MTPPITYSYTCDNCNGSCVCPRSEDGSDPCSICKGLGYVSEDVHIARSGNCLTIRNSSIPTVDDFDVVLVGQS